MSMGELKRMEDMNDKEFMERLMERIDNTPTDVIAAGLLMYEKALYNVEAIGTAAVKERMQHSLKGHSDKDDDACTNGELAYAAIAYIMYATLIDTFASKQNTNSALIEVDDNAKAIALETIQKSGAWPFDSKFDPHGTVEEIYVKAMSLIIAEIERMHRRDKKDDYVSSYIGPQSE